MAIKAVVTTSYGEERELYLRLNSIVISNHGVKSTGLVRGYISEEAYRTGMQYIYEIEVDIDIAVNSNAWEQVYAELNKIYIDAIDC